VNIYLLYFCLCAFLSWITCELSITFLRKHFLIKPIKRSSHDKDKPTAGGIHFVTISTIFSYLNNFIMPLNCIPLSIIGFIDDKFNLKPIYRLVFQITTICILLNNSPINNYLLENFNFISYYLIEIILIFCATACINFINFVDGLDGLLSGTMFIIISTLAISNPNLWIISGSIFGFLFLNWNPSKVFMGDGGSTFLGAIYIGILTSSNNIIDFTKIVLLASPILVDPFICVIRRLYNKKSIITPHKSFLFQRLNLGGLSHQNISLIYIFLTSLLSLSYIFGNIFWMILIIILEIPIAFYLEIKVASKFN